MGRKDSMNSASLPIDNYRKQIGKHDQKKDKLGPSKKLKEMKEAKSSQMSIKEVMLVLGTILAIVVGLYFLAYAYLAQPNST